MAKGKIQHMGRYENQQLLLTIKKTTIHTQLNSKLWTPHSHGSQVPPNPVPFHYHGPLYHWCHQQSLPSRADLLLLFHCLRGGGGKWCLLMAILGKLHN